jgi:hypothetical protein
VALLGKPTAENPPKTKKTQSAQATWLEYIGLKARVRTTTF